MKTHEADHKERLEAALKTLNDDPALSAPGFCQTIRADVGEADPSLARTGPLPQMGVSRGEATGPQDLEVVGLLGEGGMGLVHLARQRSLGREVAIKTLKPGVKSHKAPLSLLREAILTGGLEHPNVIPVHALGLDESGLPMLVMKRVEGVPWGDLIADPALIVGEVAEPLLYHLSVLIQVCNAVHFAHARGIVHRDLKPQNVMVGRYGEVYLMDWGIAVELAQVGGAEAGGLVGTPAYMAPEMTHNDPSLISERTDVFLLGAILHEILTGSPPHTGPSIFTVLLKAAQAAPRTYDEAVPAELAAICNKATSADPQDRYEGALALRRALERFVQHRDSFRISAQSHRQLEALLGLLAASPVDDDAADKAFGACRFGFQQALSIWEGNELAREGLQRALKAMIEHELEAGNARGAAAMLLDMPERDPDIQARIEALRKTNEAREAELELLRQLNDSPAAVRQRQVFFSIAAFPLTVGPLTAAILQAWFGLQITTTLLFRATSVVALLILMMVTLRWRRLAPHRVNRTLIKSLIVLIGAICVHRGVAVVTDMDLHHLLLSELVMITALLTTTALIVDRALLWGLPIFGVALALSVSWPQATIGLLGISNILISTIIGLTWRRAASTALPP